MVATLKIENLSIKYHTLDDETEAVKNLNLDVNDGEFISIVGPSGCGKTTILSAIAGLLRPSSGKIYLDGSEINYPCNKNCNKIGYMLQRDHLFEWRSILKNVTLGLEIQNKFNKNSVKKIEDMLQKYGLLSFKDYYPHQLSGGMRQRVALIRTLATDPEILLLDEPFSALDYQTRLAVSDEIYKIIKDEGKTTIMVTHDIAESISLSDRVVVLSKRPAQIKNIYDIKLSVENRTPLKSREAPEFRYYFNAIWKELDIHVE
ncbi:ABC transporter ATP-binding protein [Fonticella tunisiensis]|uniref:NitT/TauT family transport system ATP-binding protein n=1 Tax=Fonticella tunisiensis TaxID=1096341 RepID=A0A4V6Q2Z0_9CLOT|nr:ABC transporter ATP-binding protein [Fonticella tunisiensis]TDT61087.1 NitT/TauT family transport system ATP-binding protein [Fonticella tunisiensis]